MNNIDLMRGGGYLPVTYPIAFTKHVKDLVDAWKKFCALPLEVKSKIGWTKYGGYEHKDVVGTTLDLKENFHISPLLKSPLFLGVYVDDQQYLGMNDASCDIFNILSSQNFLTSYLQDFERIIPGIIDKVAKNPHSMTIRLLHYYPSDNNEVIAHQHIDKGLMTLHLYESGAGLNSSFFDRSGKLHSSKEVVIPEGKGILFPGLQGQYVSNNNLHALWHHVDSTPESRKEGRYSVVIFFDHPEYPHYNKKKFGRTQGLPLGFNYKASPAQLANYFTDESMED